MTDIFTEVEQDLRRERLNRLWNRFGIYIIALAILIVVVVGGWSAYDAWQTSRARAAGEAFTAALEAAEVGNTTASAEALIAYAADAPEGYAMLARFRAATAYADGGETEAAADVLNGLANDADVPALYRDVARVRLANIYLDAGDAASAEAAVAALAEDTANPMNSVAQEMMGLAAYMRDDTAAARRWFVSLRDAAGVAPEVQQRARLMLALIDQTTTAAAAAPAATQTSAPAAPVQETE